MLVNTDARFETYTMKGVQHSETIYFNGGTARLGEISDELIIIIYSGLTSTEVKKCASKKVLVNSKNHIVNDWNNTCRW